MGKQKTENENVDNDIMNQLSDEEELYKNVESSEMDVDDTDKQESVSIIQSNEEASEHTEVIEKQVEPEEREMGKQVQEEIDEQIVEVNTKKPSENEEPAERGLEKSISEN